jgi:RNA polymerase sigma-70 factor, ECF subfamily
MASRASERSQSVGLVIRPPLGGSLSPEQFAEFYAASFRRLVGQLYAMTGDQAEAQDAVQEAFVRAWARREKLDRSGAPDACVRATAWRIAISRWRRARLGRLLARKHSPPDATGGPNPDRVAVVAAPGEGGARTAARARPLLPV